MPKAKGRMKTKLGFRTIGISKEDMMKRKHMKEVFTKTETKNNRHKKYHFRKISF
jgi:hypothetical protein